MKIQDELLSCCCSITFTSREGLLPSKLPLASTRSSDCHCSTSTLTPMSTPDSFSTPLQHHAVRRLKSGRVSHTTPSQASSRASSSQDVFSTPPCSSRTSSSTHSARYGALQTPAGSPRTPIQGTPSRRKGAVRIVRGPQKPWYERCVVLTDVLHYTIELTESFPDLQNCQSKYGTVMNYN